MILKALPGLAVLVFCLGHLSAVPSTAATTLVGCCRSEHAFH